MKVVHCFADGHNEYNSSHWRSGIPCQALRKADYDVSQVHIDKWLRDKDRALFAKADLIILQRVLVEESLDRAVFWRERGKAVATDWDDSYALLDDSMKNQAHRFWKDGIVDITYDQRTKFAKRLETHPLEQFKRGLRLISGGITPSRILNEDWQHVCKMWHIPNFIDADRYLPYRKVVAERNTNELIIGWGGSLSHIVSFEKSGVLEALRRVFQKRKNVKFLLCGDERIMNLLRLPRDRVIYQGYVPWYTWPQVLSRFDIYIAPLAGRYDDSRSAIKMMEGTTMGIPTIASGSPAYQDWINNKIGIFTSDSNDDIVSIGGRAEEWEKLLLDVIDHYPERKQEAQGWISYAEKWSVDANIERIADTYRNIIKHG